MANAGLAGVTRKGITEDLCQLPDEVLCLCMTIGSSLA
jgi:hypothetical protein